MFEKAAEEKYCKGCKLRMEQCLWAWRNTNGLNELKNCSCKEVPTYIRGAEFGYNKANEWHKVTEKLPEHENLVCNQDGEPCWYDSETDQWLDVEGTRTKTIEWCDMPTKEIE